MKKLKHIKSFNELNENSDSFESDKEKEGDEEAWYEPEDCEDCRVSMEESDIEYTPDFTWKDGTWVCDHCGRPQ